MATQNIIIKGSVIDKNKRPLPNLRIEAWDADLLVNDFVGEAITDSNGGFQITFTQSRFKELFFDNKPDLYFKIYYGKTLIHSTEKSLLWNVSSNVENLQIVVDVPSVLPNKNKGSNVVLGKVTDGRSRPLANLTVEIYDVDMREWKALANTFTNKDGKYEVRWSHDESTGQGKKTADLAVKVFSKEKNTELFKTTMSQVRFNASKREQINVTIQQAVPTEVVEFDFLVNEVSCLAGEVAIADLQENQEHSDVTFLSKELEVPSDKIEHLIVAHRLQNLSKIDAAFFYALLRKNTLLHNNFSKDLSARLSIGIGTDDKTLLYDAALTDSTVIEADIKAAVDEKIVSPAEAEHVSRNIALLDQYKDDASGYYKNEHPQKVIDLLANFFKEGKLQEVQQLFAQNKNDLNSFFDKITDPSFYESEEKEQDAKTNVELGKIFGFGNTVIPQIAKAKGIKHAGEARKLAKLNIAGWVEEITKVRPDLKDTQMIKSYASAIVRKMEKEFPTAAFAAQLERSEKSVLNNQEKIVSFFNEHEDFEMTKHNVDLYLKVKEVAAEDKAAITEELKSVQRVFKLVPNYRKTIALKEEKIHSSHSIVALGKTRFVNEVAPKAKIEANEANKIFRKAETKTTAAMLMVGNLQDSMSVMDIASFETTTLARTLELVSEDFPNLQSLFKLVDTCECEHCRSVYSPAAYLVEILQFLDNRTVVANNAKDILFSRRPELGDIDLGCANANTPVKYIDLVCEILEEAIAPDQGIDYTGLLSDGADPVHGNISNDLLTALTDAGLTVTADALIFGTETETTLTTGPYYLRDTGIVCKIVNTSGDIYKVYRLRQTFGTAEELDAAPEYVNDAAYIELNSEAFAFTLPFDLSHTEAKAYLNRFNVNRAELMQAFQIGSVLTDENIAAERLGLTDAERTIIFNAPAPNDNAAQQAYWNVPAPGDVVDYLSVVDHFLDRTRLTYKELDLLLKLDFIDPDGNLYILHDDLSCDTALKTIANLDLDALDRIHRFLRLQKKTGWKYVVLDAIITQGNLGATLLDDNCLLRAAQLKEISEKTKIKIDELIGCFGEIPHVIVDDQDEKAPKPLYHQLFLNKARNGVIDEGLLPELVDASQLVETYLSYIAVCLQMKQVDLEYITPLLPNGDLTFSNLSLLYAASKLIKKLKIKAEDFAILHTLSGIAISSSPEETLEFIQFIEDFKTSPLKATDVKFVLNHDATNLTDREITVEKIEEILNKLKDGYETINDELQSKYDANLSAEEQTETFIAVVSGLLGKLDADGTINEITEDDVKIIVKFLDQDWLDVTDVAGAIAFIDEKFDEGIVRTTIDAALIALDAVPDGDDSSAEQLALIEAILDSIADYQIATGKQTLLAETLSTAFKADLDLTEIVLTYAVLKKGVPGTDFISDLLLDDFILDITSADFPNQYAAIRLLHKLFALLNAFKLSNTDVEWYFVNNADLALEWFELDDIPYEFGQAAIDIDTYIAFCKIASYSKELTDVTNPLDAENPISFLSVADYILLGAAADRDVFLNDLALLTGYEKEVLDAIDAHLFSVFDSGNYNDPENWKLLFECANFARKLDATIDQIVTYITPTLTSSEVSDLRATLKSRYDEDTWLSTLKEIMDTIRPQKRDALIAYLLATNPEMSEENDLFEYFLVDVEMGACMPSSRIVQAHNSIQVFVQRCLMGLEPDALADIDTDPNWNQWEWMKNYRVWEANRKVFLYPENWYDVSLTDDPSYLLTEFINELQQNELTNDTAEESIKNYLEKLDNIAFLEVMATWYDIPTRDMHVFARTKGGDPSLYYYRRFESERYWTPWEKVELDITGDHLLAFMRNDRLNLAWPMFSEEAQPDQQSKVPSSDDQGDHVDVDQPKKKLKIQLAISEYNNTKWQPKKVSSDCILTPTDYTDDETLLSRENFNLIYLQLTDQVMVFSSTWDNIDYHTKRGVFDIAGCKGYPELVFEGDEYFPDFLPDFKEAELTSQRYKELTDYDPDDLSVKNGMSPFNYYEILNTTPGQFRISYPHQFTSIDLIVLIFQFIQLILQSGKGNVKERNFKIPLGTMLPYFEEDSDHAYVIIPGFYKKVTESSEFRETYTLDDSDKRTASDVFQLMDDISNWFKSISAEFEANPPANTSDAINTILSDASFQDILKELSMYADFDVLLTILIGVSDDPTVDEFLNGLILEEPLKYGEQFKNMYHPLVCALRSTLYKDGVSGLMNRATQLQTTDFDFGEYYNPNKLIVPQTYIKNPDGTKTLSFPIEDLDFSSDGSYSAYNWDLFFRVPLHIAVSLTKNQRFEEALTWFHYMFNPTGALSGTGVQKYWVTKPFYLNQEVDYVTQRIDTLMYVVSDPEHGNVPVGAASDPAIRDLEFAISEWRDNPFDPDVVARYRPVAYQKALLMKYIDNLTEWGDYLFRQDTMESVAQATQMYILADKLLGPKPRIVPSPIKKPYETYNQIEAKLDSFGNALIELENILPDLTVLPEGGNELPPSPVTLSMLYFCIPANEKMFEYWDRVADRLFKIRHCQNIDGVERSLALFAPPIDPGMLVRAAASGLSLSAVIAGMNAPTPYYRFNVLSQKATELAQEVRGLGNSLLQALEKKDGEALSLLRGELELKVLNAVKDIKKLQINESNEQIEVLKRTKKVTEERQKYYASIEKIISNEQLNLDKLKEASDYQRDSQIVRTIAGALRLIPEFHVGASGFGGSPKVVMQLGGSAISTATSIGADILNILGSIASYEANRASILGGYDRRYADWQLQERLATKELASIDKQIAAAQIRKEISTTDLKNHELQIENAKKTDDFMRSKFTNKDLYDWMKGQISSVYFKSYQLAHDFAKKAERCYKFELGNDDSYISYGYWDSMKKGLQAADHLIHDIKRMETGYLDKNKREYEITKHVSLAQLDPLALVRLRATGICDFEIPEVLYDMDHAGHYFRRLKSVSMSLPCIAGPYTSVSAKLSLVNNRYRKNTNPNAGYAEDPAGDDRFIYNVGAIQSIATSNAQNDSGVFELNFRDERYLPFENTGAISSWRLELPTEIKQFDYETISDVIIHVKYTAREGGSGLKSLANDVLKEQLDAIAQGLEENGLHVAINMKHDLPNEWLLFKNNGSIDLTLDKSRFPYMVQAFETTIESVMFVAKTTTPADFTIDVDADTTDAVVAVPLVLGLLTDLGLSKGINSDIELDTQFNLSVLDDTERLKLEELMMVVKYAFTLTP